MAMAQGLLLVPLYLRFIPIEIYGAWLASGNLLAWISVTDPGLTTVLQQQVANSYGKNDLLKTKTLIGGGLILSVLILIIAIFFGLICAYFLPTWISLPPNIDILLIVKAFTLAVFGTSLMLFSFSIRAINQGMQGSLSIGLINNGVTLTSIIITIILLFTGFGLMALPVSLIFSGVFYSIGHVLYLLWRVINEKIGISFSFKEIVRLTKLLSYTFLGRTTGTISNNVDLIIVSRFLGPETVAVLALTRKPIDLSREIINQPVVSFMPAISHLSGWVEEPRLNCRHWPEQPDSEQAPEACPVLHESHHDWPTVVRLKDIWQQR